MSNEAAFEKESTKVADVVKNGTSPEAAEALSQALLPMNHKDYRSFLEAVVDKTGNSEVGNKLDITRTVAHLWSRSDLQPDYVVVTPGVTLTAVCKNEMGAAAKQSELNACIKSFSKLNELEDPNKIEAGKTLKIPGSIY
jgi:hypothetical protein